MFDWYYLTKSIESSSLSEVEKERIIDRLIVLEGKEDEFSFEETRELINKVRSNQYDLIAFGFNYSQKDIMQKLRKTRPIKE